MRRSSFNLFSLYSDHPYLIFSYSHHSLPSARPNLGRFGASDLLTRSRDLKSIQNLSAESVDIVAGEDNPRATERTRLVVFILKSGG